MTSSPSPLLTYTIQPGRPQEGSTYSFASGEPIKFNDPNVEGGSQQSGILLYDPAIQLWYINYAKVGENNKITYLSPNLLKYGVVQLIKPPPQNGGSKRRTKRGARKIKYSRSMRKFRRR